MTRRKILVVDDDEAVLDYLRAKLGARYELLAVNGRAALEAARRSWPDAVFLDLEMPVMDGYEAAVALRRMEREGGLRRCTIVAISSNDEQPIIQRALAAGCDHYLIKPPSRDALLRILAGKPPLAPAALPEAAAEDAVELDPDLEASLPAFFASRRKALDEMPAALGNGDRARFKRLAHKLAGSFTLYGFRWAAARCRELERGAVSDDSDSLRKEAENVRAHLDSVKVRLQAEEPK